MLNHKFRLYPNKEMEYKLKDKLELHRRTYNILLGELNEQKVIDKAQIQGIIPDMKICEPKFKNLHSKAMQYECYRLFSNLKGLVKSKGKRKVGRLRFKGKGWFSSFTYNQSGFRIEITGKRCQTLWLSKIGNIPIRVHRKIKGKIKQITIKRTNTDKWFAYVTTESKQNEREKKQINTAIGIDVGVKNFTMDSNGISSNNPLFLKNSLDKLAKEQKRLAKKKKGSKNRKKARLTLSKVYEKLTNQRENFLHQLSRRYVNAYDCICVEDLDINGLVRISYNPRNILDSSWNKLIQYMSYKALSAGKILVKVEARGTTQKCSNCGEIVPKELWDRTHKCSCGLEIDRDYNSAINILKLGLKKIGQELSDVPVEREPILLRASSLKEAGSHTLNTEGVRL